ncbi:DUF4253 domain-containing protein [Actinomadura miaoliensis]|uniref:DUF4253 domain-containing protein n=1 Tax=Actinomadura miaoliensis TaxID=430685 RepID=A0ABP7WJK0_9ACTN
MADFTFPPLPGDLPLPPGDVVHATPLRGRGTARPVLWLADERMPDAGAWWTRWYAARERTGLYPLLLGTLDDPYSGVLDQPWRTTGDLAYRSVRAIDALDAEDVLRDWWEPEVNREFHGADSALARPWPGLAAPSDPARTDPDEFAGLVAAQLTTGESLLTGLAPARRGADALTAVGWHGPLNHTNDTEEISVVVRSWEERFGARVVMVGFATLCLSVAAPPTTREHARAVAAEHYAFCPDNIDQGTGDFEEYARELVNASTWSFWWD